MKVSDFNYNLPEELIAQHPYDKRDEARLMVLDKTTQKMEHKVFKDVIEYLKARRLSGNQQYQSVASKTLWQKRHGCECRIFIIKKTGRRFLGSHGSPGK